MSSPNIGWLFDVDYFSGLDYTNIEANEENIKEKVQNIIDETPNIPSLELLGDIHFKATTTYPGLLLGSGNIHELQISLYSSTRFPFCLPLFQPSNKHLRL